MFDTIRSEFRKLLTVRSTYAIFGSVAAITIFFAGFIQGFQAEPALLGDSHLLMSQSTGAVVFVGFILAFAGLLLAGHEYRYNTIMYTLTSSNRRLKVMLAKLLVVTTFAVVTTLFITFFSPLCTIIGVHLHGHTLAHQEFYFRSILWQCLFCGWGYTMYAFILVTAMRNQIGAIVTFLLIPLIGENILSLLLKSNTKYLPFTALQAVAEPNGLGNHANSAHQALVVLVYIGVGLVLSTVLFQRRDAN